MFTKKYEFETNDKKWQGYWAQNEIFKFDKNSNKEIYSIDTPPPTINGNIHMGHLSSYTHIDVIARHQKKLGKEIYFPFGFDDNGLPTERYIEKKFKIKAHEMPRSEFISICNNETLELEKEFKKLYESIGYSANLNNCYNTISEKSRKISQESFIKLYQDGKISHKDGACLWCIECHTAIAQSEIETKEIESTLNYIKFSLKNSEDKLIIATSRPELLCGCDCLFINPKDTKNNKFIGMTAITPIYNIEVPILANPDTDMNKGTGIVMCCTFGDEADCKWQKKYNLEIKECISPNGIMLDIAGKYAGFSTIKARELIIADLKKLDLLIKEEPITHMVATHERCGKPIEILSKKQWFIRILDMKNVLIDATNKLNWHPISMKSRLINWIDALKWDWCISRQRYYGIPFPIWYCKKCGEIILPSIDELPIDPNESLPKKPCKCGCNEFIPETDVMDTWATSSLSPQIARDIEFGSGLTDIGLPYSLRPNAHDNIRVWDFYTMIKSLLHFQKLPWQDIMISGFINSENNEKLSKSKSNSKSTPWQLIKTWSPDILRYWACYTSLGKDRAMSFDDFVSGQKLSNKLWNLAKFASLFLENYKPAICEFTNIDKYYLNKFSKEQASFIEKLNDCEIGLAIKELEIFFWDFCDNYIEIIKHNLYKPEIYGEKGKESARFTLYTILYEIIKQFSLYFPHITEEIYYKIFKQNECYKSIYLTEYKMLDLQSCQTEQCENLLYIIGEIRKAKSLKNLSMKEEIKELVLYGFCPFDDDLANNLKSCCSITKLQYKSSKNINIDVKF